MGHEQSAGDAATVSGWTTTEDAVLSLEAGEVRRLVWEGVLLLDARSARDQALSPHRAATHLSHQAPREELIQRCRDRSEPVICCSNHELRARRLAVRLNRLGYKHVYVLRGGLAALTSQLLG